MEPIALGGGRGLLFGDVSQLELGVRGRDLLDDERRARAHEFAFAADETTKRRWRDATNTLLRSLAADWIERSSEVALQGEFLAALFTRVLGYAGALSGRTPFTLSASVTTEVDATEADATLGWFTAPGVGTTRAVIELKDARTNLDRRQLSRRDRLTPVDQAFLYATKFAGCEWVIVSNFLEARLYSTKHGQGVYEFFSLPELGDDERLTAFVSLFCPDALIGTRSEGHGYLADLLGQRPTTRQREITEDFYRRYADKRNRLIQHFLEQQPDVDSHDLIAATQKLLDRLLFVAFAEDRTLLPRNILRETAEIASRSRSRSATRIWDELKALLRDIDSGRDDVAPPIPEYDGGLFAHDPLLDDQLAVPDELARELVALGDYDYRRSINVEILGHVFEQSIADLENLRRAHSLDPHGVEADAGGLADVRRARGVFYTPPWVTGYLADTTIGQVAMAQEVTAERLAGLTILDPACGSGAFLAQAYRYLLELAEASIPEVLPEQQAALLEQEAVIQPSRYLGALHGIDIMPEAVEIVRLSLWLASASPLERLHGLDGVAEANTLGPGSDNGLLDDLFPDEMANGGFDVVIGNPPWGATIDFEVDRTLELAEGQFDSYELFVERAIRDALKTDGLFGFVVPDRFLRPEGERLRRWLFDRYQVLEVIKLGEGVFHGVFRAAVMVVVRKAAPASDDQIQTLVVARDDREVLEETGPTHLHGLLGERGGLISRSRIVEGPGYDIPLGASDEDLEIMAMMRERSLPWVGSEGIFDPYGRGVELGSDGFVIRCNACFEWQVGPRRRALARGGGYADKRCEHCGVVIHDGEWAEQTMIVVDEPPAEGSARDSGYPGSGWQPLYLGEDIARYRLTRPKWIRMGVPNINYKDERLYVPPKIVIRQVGVGINAAIDETEGRCLQSAYVYRVRHDRNIDPYFVLGCLASRAMLFFFHRHTNQTEWQSFPRLVHTILHAFPLPDPDVVGRDLHDELAERARQRMGLLPEEGHELDLEIEQLVMDAYHLPPEARQRIIRTLRSVQRLRVIREMFPGDEGVGPESLL